MTTIHELATSIPTDQRAALRATTEEAIADLVAFGLDGAEAMGVMDVYLASLAPLELAELYAALCLDAEVSP